MPKPKPKTTAPATYEIALEELEQLIRSVESGQLPLEEMQAAYQRSEVLLAFCRDRLDAVQDQVGVLDDGALKPLNQS
ncbi:exodeoxyribonuclease VII small subunit [Simplicispira psychrophila]|uniref:exodeoxyribonuclease VII small subunit n=1 Tax=Simplicispira psychrophila TaxID=80882 RepID=UPI0004843FF5|nr:exodeoxyribonuclease VII small subunit [Simplicispira psychrophila]